MPARDCVSATIDAFPYTRPFHSDALLTLTIVHCAGTLDALGVRLPPLTHLATNPAFALDRAAPENGMAN